VPAELLARVGIPQAIAVGAEELVALEIVSHPEESLSAWSLIAGVGEDEVEALRIIRLLDLDSSVSAVAHREADIGIPPGLPSDEVLLDTLAEVPEAENELAEAVVGVAAHHVPEDRPPADLNEGLRESGFAPRQSQPASPTQDHDFHWPALRLEEPRRSLTQGRAEEQGEPSLGRSRAWARYYTPRREDE